MKIAVRKIGPMGTTYGDQFNQDFFNNLWNEELISKLDSNDEVIWFEHMPVTGEAFDELLSDFDAVIGAWIKPGMITEGILSKHPKIKYIGTISHGYSSFDKDACKKYGITVTNAIFNDDAVSQHVFALLLEICNNVGINNSFYKKEKWQSEQPDWNKLYTRQISLSGKIFGIIGLGNIGTKTAQIARGFGMQVLANSRSIKNGEQYQKITQTSFEEVIMKSDVISIHCPLTESTLNLIDKSAIEKMKQGVILINTSRGEIIDEEALNEALMQRKVYAAGLDVLANEPLKHPNCLINNPYTVTTEHIAWASIESRIKSIKVGCENFFNWKNGTPTSVIS